MTEKVFCVRLEGKAARQFIEIKEALGLESDLDVFKVIAANYCKKVINEKLGEKQGI